MVQIHYVNATTQKTPAGGRGDVNFYTTTSAPAMEMGTIFATNQNIRVCPGDNDKTFETHCRTPMAGATIIAANGHFHSRGVEFTMNVVDSQGNDMLPAPFYTSTSWDDPPMARGLGHPHPRRRRRELDLLVLGRRVVVRQPGRLVLLHVRRQGRDARALQRVHLLLSEDAGLQLLLTLRVLLARSPWS